MIKKLIRKLLGQDARTAQDAPQDPAEPRSAAPAAPAGRAKPARGAAKKPRNGAPTIVHADVHGIDPALISKNAIRVTDTLQQAGFRAFIVGGAVRDLLLGIAPKDFDVATDATPTEVQRLFRRARLIGRRFQIVHVQFGQELIEVSTFRALVDAPQEPPADAAPAKRLKRDELDRRTHAVDASGRVLRDNVWGEQHEDAARRDFTINAMYYDPASQTVLDYHDGMADMRARLLRMIGDPATRYREDPVRMLRVVRFAAKLGFDIEEKTREPIKELADLINNVPAARLFDEMLKLLLSGHALACLKQLRKQGLHHGLLPLLDVVLEQPQGEKFVTLALNNTDARVRAGKPVSPGFLFATLLWHDMRQRFEQYSADGEFPVPALHRAMDDVIDMQTEKLAIHKRYSADMREIWGLQLRLEKRSGRSALRLLEHQRFRAGYDFLLLRCESGELDSAVGQWWTDFIDGDAATREALLTQGGSRDKSPRKRRRRGGRSRRTADSAEGAEGAARGESDAND
ncbi:polynucleotide adenylyltransferase PcnB [Burkholderia pseudomallei]|uniref:Poly(A) polymerase I n=1 Tax=Burkholderia pseudomallei TaxID=28450 RepID=A0AA40JDR3_BURPE|nr:polynucleotide adenylyltransferase PcnB [Burkholderia pseudomallei]AIV85724.1 poly(A) polymerase family protein [Burkholderia pseudomallei MSHR3965]KGS99300.1 poly(A) polymerase family protein [Burkholderia pseudomallei]KGU71694.1 poly(A) polymerase family protein [Burkholderia pseudomallei MSHR4304]KGV32880.1 poly(A) polymerase family protein [Burkholderia pseudomallei MSHR4308]KGV69407.1 poly(A) polymerase family protein [Burkholderia pseudomallei MSHR4375]